MKITNEEVLTYAYQQRYNQKAGKPIELDTPAQRRAMERILITYIAQNCYTEDKQEPNYPFNLIETVFQGDIDFESWTQDNIDGFDVAMNSLSDRERIVLYLRFHDGLIFDDVAKHFKVTRERIRQVEAKAMRKLRHPSVSKWFVKGKHSCEEAYFEQIKEEKEREYKEACNFVMNEIKSDREKLVAALVRLDRELGNEVSYDVPEKSAEEVNGEISIEDVDFSVRTFNCIKRHGVKTLAELADMTEGELRKIRNLGKKSMDEIKGMLKAYGLSLKEEG